MTPTPEDLTAARQAAEQIALDEAACTRGRLYEIHDLDMDRALAVRDELAAALTAAEDIAAETAVRVRDELAANGEGHRDFWIRLQVRDQDTGQPHRQVALAVSEEPR
jgi:hypothetical protein